MRRFVVFLSAATIALAATAVRADSGGSMGSMGSMPASKPVIVTPSTVKWMPGSGEMKGLTVAVLDGDPNKAGPWTIRIKIPAGTKFPVHYHNDTERVTVISGAFKAAIGEKYDATKLVTLPAGSFVVIPAGVRHFAAASVDAVLQISGTKVFAMKMDKGSM